MRAKLRFTEKIDTGVAVSKNVCIFAVPKTNMVPIVQLVRASDCGSECRGFESHWAPRKRKSAWLSLFLSSGVLFRLEMLAQCKIPVVLHPVHQSPRFHGQKSILLLFIHENTAFRGQKHHKACGTSTCGVARAAGWRIGQLRCPAQPIWFSIIIREYASFPGRSNANCDFRPENPPFLRTGRPI